MIFKDYAENLRVLSQHIHPMCLRNLEVLHGMYLTYKNGTIKTGTISVSSSLRKSFV